MWIFVIIKYKRNIHIWCYWVVSYISIEPYCTYTGILSIISVNINDPGSYSTKNVKLKIKTSPSIIPKTHSNLLKIRGGGVDPLIMPIFVYHLSLGGNFY